MKILSSFLLSFIYFLSFGQNAPLPKPYPLRTEQENLQTELLIRISDYSYIIGKQLPEFSFKVKKGEEINNKYLKGKVVLLNFWFESCKFCHNLFEPINNIYDHFKDSTGFEVISISFDSPSTIDANIAKYNLTYPNYSVDEKLFRKLMFDKGYPYNLLINKNGIITDAFGINQILENTLFFEEVLIPKIDSMLLKNK